jgi:hypothetical protein
MPKTIPTILAIAVLAGSTIQYAAAAEHHRARHVVRAPVVSEPIRNSKAYNSNVYNSNAYYGWRNPSPEPYRYDEALSPPAGH